MGHGYSSDRGGEDDGAVGGPIELEGAVSKRFLLGK